MKYIEAPNRHDVYSNYEWSLFLGGGISDCPPWQPVVASNLDIYCDDLVVYNPRRVKWDSSIDSREQIKWEHEYLDKSNIILFWFCKETMCPITLFEYGKFIRNNSKYIVVGCDPEYARKDDLIVQSELESRKVLFSLDEVIETLHKLIKYRVDIKEN